MAMDYPFHRAPLQRLRQSSMRAGTFAQPFRRQEGSIAIMFAIMVLILLGFIGLAINASQLYNRKVELQSVADAAALAAARELNGTAAGIAAALSKAATTANSMKYQYHQQDVSWSDAAIRFSTAANATESEWLDAGAAGSAPDGLLFARVQTSALDAAVGQVSTAFMGILSEAHATSTVSASATAGRSSIRITPFAICALSNTPATGRSNPFPPANVELEEFGFRRGVAYDLMQLNPNGTTGETFVVNPIDPLGALGSPSNTATDVVGPYVCAGKMPMARVMGGTITVGRPFPLGALFTHLNSRFDQYVGNVCTPFEAPPDANIKSYAVPGTIPWMNTAATMAPAFQAAKPLTTGSKLWTIASPPTPQSPTDATMYGPLWSFAKAVPFSQYTAGVAEPATGYTPFGTASWPTLYRPSSPGTITPLVNGYPATTPYLASGGATFQAPSCLPGIRLRRVLNVPLLSCPVVAGSNVSANVLGIGRFFMTVPATATTLHAEFAGAVPEQSLGGPVELFP